MPILTGSHVMATAILGTIDRANSRGLVQCKTMLDGLARAGEVASGDQKTFPMCVTVGASM